MNHILPHTIAYQHYVSATKLTVLMIAALFLPAVAYSQQYTIADDEYAVAYKKALEEYNELHQRKAELIDSMKRQKQQIKKFDESHSRLVGMIKNQQRKLDKISNDKNIQLYDSLTQAKHVLRDSIAFLRIQSADLDALIAVETASVAKTDSCKAELKAIRDKILTHTINKHSCFIEQSFLTMDKEVLNQIWSDCQAYATEDTMKTFIVKVDKTKKNLATYQSAISVLNSPYDPKLVADATANLKATMCISSDQQIDVNNAIAALDAYPKGLQAFVDWINGINDRRKGISDYTFFEEDKGYILDNNNLGQRIDMYLLKVPYLKTKYEEFMVAFTKDPNKQHYPAETEINEQYSKFFKNIY